MTQYDPALDAHISSNWGNAHRLLDLLEDRRLLSDRHSLEDASYCILSALQIRETMTVMMAATTPGPLKEALREIRAACRAFVHAGGPNGQHFDQSHDLFAINLTALRLAVARQVMSVMSTFGLSSSPETRRLVEIIQSERRPGS
ncbi:hypothetical protein [Microbacterium sp.]|uniref:hypothetical protein n=1 Tax=Microbacterium sp. TaxID=51671 RepID=UPI0025D93592|nr:hypothetical protein [Microbacterium sp.]MBT9608152.1 hypothetical protein [Microbacterium sp.]